MDDVKVPLFVRTALNDTDRQLQSKVRQHLVSSFMEEAPGQVARDVIAMVREHYDAVILALVRHYNPSPNEEAPVD